MNPQSNFKMFLISKSMCFATCFASWPFKIEVLLLTYIAQEQTYPEMSQFYVNLYTMITLIDQTKP